MLGVWSGTREKSRRKEEKSATYKHLPTIEAIFEKTEGLHLKKKKNETKKKKKKKRSETSNQKFDCTRRKSLFEQTITKIMDKQCQSQQH